MSTLYSETPVLTSRQVFISAPKLLYRPRGRYSSVLRNSCADFVACIHQHSENSVLTSSQVFISVPKTNHWICLVRESSGSTEP